MVLAPASLELRPAPSLGATVTTVNLKLAKIAPAPYAAEQLASEEPLGPATIVVRPPKSAGGRGPDPWLESVPVELAR